MIQLALLVYLLAGFFAYVGWQRGWTKEVISLAGITLGIFALWHFRTLITVTLFGDIPRGQVFYIQCFIFIGIVFFAYQTRGLAERAGRREDREELQSKVLGAVVGGVNGWLIGGTIWYFLDSAAYPLNPLVVAPTAGSSSAAMVSSLPVYILTAGEGNLLALMVVLLFVFVLVLI
jgi:uncharacterized membrane protein required for colicin V production